MSSNDHLKSIIERIENMEEEKSNIMEDIKEIYMEAKGNGFDPKALRQVVRIRKKDKHEHEQEQAILDTYLHSLGE